MDDDDVIAEHEDDFAAADLANLRRPPNRRGFWIVNRPLVSAIGRAEHDLRLIHGRALDIETTTGSFADADASALGLPGDTVTLIDGTTATTEQGQVSVYATADGWAAAAEARPNACFYIAQDAHGASTRYGGGTVCSGEAAFRLAQDSTW
jgi:hypothetical protein